MNCERVSRIYFIISPPLLSFPFLTLSCLVSNPTSPFPPPFSFSPIPLQAYKVLFPYTPQKDDELELMEGDFIYVSATDQGQTGVFVNPSIECFGTIFVIIMKICLQCLGYLLLSHPFLLLLMGYLD